MPAWPFLSPSWPLWPSAVAASPFSRLQSQLAPLPSELESSCHIPLSPASDWIAEAPVLGFDPVDMLNRCMMNNETPIVTRLHSVLFSTFSVAANRTF